MTRLAVNGLRQYLGTLAEMLATTNRNPGGWTSIQQLVLERGVVFTGPGEALTDAELMLIDVCSWDGYALKECFFNAQRLSFYTDGRLRYFEGFAIGPATIPCHHAWVVTESDKVIDLTWRGTMEHPSPGKWGDRYAVGTMPAPAAYIGVEIDASDALARMMKSSECISYLDDWPNGWPLLKREAWNDAAPS